MAVGAGCLSGASGSQRKRTSLAAARRNHSQLTALDKVGTGGGRGGRGGWRLKGSRNEEKVVPNNQVLKPPGLLWHIVVSGNIAQRRGAIRRG